MDMVMEKKDAFFIRTKSPTTQRTWITPIVFTSRAAAEQYHRVNLVWMEAMKPAYGFRIIPFAAVVDTDLEYGKYLASDSSLATLRTTADFLAFWENTSAPVVDVVANAVWAVHDRRIQPSLAIDELHRQLDGRIAAGL